MTPKTLTAIHYLHIKISHKITDNFGSPCSTNSVNNINNCDYNQAFDILNYLYPNEVTQKPMKGATSQNSVS